MTRGETAATVIRDGPGHLGRSRTAEWRSRTAEWRSPGALAGVALVVAMVTAAAVGSATGVATADYVASDSTRVDAAGTVTDRSVEIRYNPSFAGTNSDLEATAEYFYVETVGGETVRFGPDASTGIRIRNTDTGQSVTLRPNAGEQTVAMDFFNVNANRITDEGRHWIEVRGPTVDGIDAEINVSVTGDTGMFNQSVFAPFEVQLVDADGDVFASTGSRIHGVNYPDYDVEYNGSALAVTRDPAVDEDWYVVLEQDFEYLAEVDDSAGDSHFVVSTDGIGLNESDWFTVEIYRNETAAEEIGNRIVGLSGSIEEENRVVGPVGSDGTSLAARSLSSAQVAPGGEVTVTLTGIARGSQFSVEEQFTPEVDTATVETVTVNGDPVTPSRAVATDGGLILELDGLESGDGVTAKYTVSVENDAIDGETVDISGQASSGDRREVPVGTDTLTVETGPSLDPPVRGYDADSDGRIDIAELGDAASDYARGRIDITELGAVAAAYARG